VFYTAVSTGWTWGYAATSDAGNLVSYNLLHDIFQGELSDGGCVYNLGRSPGTVIDHNVCHTSNPFAYGGWGLYTDEGSSNVTLSNNIVFSTKDASFHQVRATLAVPARSHARMGAVRPRCASCALASHPHARTRPHAAPSTHSQHYGTDNVIENNIFAFGSSLECVGEASNGDCDVSAIKSSQHPVAQHDAGVNSSFTFRRNIVLLGAQEPAAAPFAVNTTHIFVSASHTCVDTQRVL